MYVRLFKPILETILALVVLLLASPIFVFIYLALLIANRGSVFFTQPRPGKHERVFNVIKFKTMNDKKDASGKLLPDAKRLTKIGRFIRTTSLDEIPQLLNVIKGDMSLIGPRPLLVRYLERYTPEQARRHEVRPGITGWAQVNGRNAISWEKKFELDVYYVDHLSFSFDLKILWLTAQKVLRREGISSGTSATVEEFKGSIKT
ncbi:sugar transferase [Lewinella cohaerens]|uniref:sugar transferase n=1 Tax=Lewinella cohaerens TaxID=70995 RepID=UPI000377F8F1|nr:sugar transferase [Lewinella cohaerens]